jgi:hypothetical protein
MFGPVKRPLYHGLLGHSAAMPSSPATADPPAYSSVICWKLPRMLTTIFGEMV